MNVFNILNAENYCALALAVSSDHYLTPENAFDYLARGRRPTVGSFRNNQTITDDDVADMIAMKQTETWKDIGECYGLNPSAVFRRVERFKAAI